MKIKSLFIAALAMVALVACNKKDVADVPSGEKAIVVSVNVGNLQTRGLVETPVAVGTDVKSGVEKLDVYAISSTNSVSAVVSLDKAGFDAAVNTATGKATIALGAVEAGVTKIYVVANSQIAAAAVGTKLTDIKIFDKVEDEKPNPGIEKAVMSGDGDATGMPATAGGTLDVPVTIKPQLSRIEIFGQPLYTNSKLTEFEILAVYLDTYSKVIAETPKVAAVAAQTVFPIASYPLQVAVADLAESNKVLAKEKAIAFHLFPQETPRIFLKVRMVYDGSTITDHISFVNLFAEPAAAAAAADLAPVGQLQAGFVYKIDLAKVDWNKTGKYEDPTTDPDWPNIDPDKPGIPDVLTPKHVLPILSDTKDVSAIVEIAPWSFANIIPGL